MAGFPTGLEATATDPDGDAVSLSWTHDDGATATGERPGKAWDVPGTHTATVTATDPTGLTATHTFTIEITPNPDGYKPLSTAPPPGWVPPAMSARPVAALPDAGLRLSTTGAIAVRIGCKTLRCRGTVALARGSRLIGRAPFSVPEARTR